MSQLLYSKNLMIIVIFIILFRIKLTEKTLFVVCDFLY